MWIAGQRVDSGQRTPITSPWDGRVVAEVSQAGNEHVEAALAAAMAARPRLQRQPAGARRAVLTRLAALLEAKAGPMAELIIEQAGKPRAAAKVEVQRAVEGLTLAAAELARFGGEVVPVDLLASGHGTSAEVRRFPAGVVVGIVPFNFPLNLGMHKVAPALAVGAPIIVKPPPQAPGPQLLLAELALEAGADPCALQVLPCDNTVAEALSRDSRVRVVSFTGSARVGWFLKQVCPGKVLLELGGNAAAIVCADADVTTAASRLATSAFTYAGQVCIKVQRIIVEAPAYDAFVEAFLARTRELAVGDPRRDDTVVGPVIDDRAAERIEAWVEEALAAGARAALRGNRTGRLLQPTVLLDVPRHVRAYREEIFGPVVILERAASFEEAMERVNDSDYGLQAGLFTFDLRKVRAAFEALEVGGVIVNDSPSFRSDNMPYGGVKQSGLGREGIRAAMAELTEERVLVLRPT